MMTTSKLLTLLAVCSFCLTNCKARKPARSGLDEAWDKANSPEQFDVKALNYKDLIKDAYRLGQTANAPWSDDYWPLNQGGFAKRWSETARLAKFKTITSHEDLDYNEFKKSSATLVKDDVASSQKLVGKDFKETAGASGAEKIDLVLGRKTMPMLSQELNKFVRDAQAFEGTEWGWMGHCHGWAAASVLYAPPKHGVLMKSTSGQEVLFTPGDIRGVLTKAAADTKIEGRQQFLGTRCNDSRLVTPKDSLGRYIDGALGINPNDDGVMADFVPIRIEQNNYLMTGELNSETKALTFRVGPKFKDANSKLYWLEVRGRHSESRKTDAVRIYTTQVNSKGMIKPALLIYSDLPSELGIQFDSQDKRSTTRDEAKAREEYKLMMASAPESLKATQKLAFKSWKQCRDLNPGTFHLVLASLLSEGGRAGKPARGFVMDVTRDDQVWNHPIYDFATVLGEPTELKIEDVEDPYKEWRAPTATHIVDVMTTITYGIENGPRIIYQEGEDALNEAVYRYTLELDKDGVVVGGEWHSEAGVGSGMKSGKALLEDLKVAAQRELTQDVAAPDFIWGYPSGVKIKGSAMMPGDFIEKLHSCSIKEGDVQTVALSGIEVPYVSCQYPE